TGTVVLAGLDAVDELAGSATKELGGIDVLVHNAALSNYHADGLTTPWDDVEYLIRLAHLSPVRLPRAVVPAMVERGEGRVVVVSSMAKQMSSPGESAY